MKKPTQCILWKKDKLIPQDLHYENFDLIETFEEDSHFSRKLVKCKECGQLYFKEFYEEIDWVNGNDPQYWTYIPIETQDEIETLKKASPLELLQFVPRLQDDFPKDAKEPTVRWMGK